MLTDRTRHQYGMFDSITDALTGSLNTAASASIVTNNVLSSFTEVSGNIAAPNVHDGLTVFSRGYDRNLSGSWSPITVVKNTEDVPNQVFYGNIEMLLYATASLTPAQSQAIAARGDVEGYKLVRNKSYDAANNADQVISVNGPETQQAGLTIAAVTNGAAATYYYYIDMTNYSILGLQLILSGTITLTIEGTMQDDGTAAASCTYINITNALYGAVSYAASAALIDSNRVAGLFKYIRVKVVAGGAGTDDWTIYSKKIYA